MRHQKNGVRIKKPVPPPQNRRPQDKTPNQPKSALPRWALILVCLLVAGGGSWAFFEFGIWSKLPRELVGKWVVTEGPDEGGTIDFYRGGSMVAKVNLAGKLGIIEAKVEVEGKKIIATVQNKYTGEQGTRVQTIKVLDSKRLVLEDEGGKQIKLEKAY